MTSKIKVNPLVLALLLAVIATVKPQAQTVQTLCSFTGTNGANPMAALTLGNDGNFYGTTEQGGSLEYGTVFKMTSSGNLTILATFVGTNGAYPMASLTLGNDGNFYGTTEGDYYDNYGTVFKMTTNGNLSTLVSFDGTNGGYPESALTLGNDGNFYGTTVGGYLAGYGTVFKMTSSCHRADQNRPVVSDSKPATLR